MGAGRIKNIPDVKLRALVQKLNRQALHAKVLGFKHPQGEDYMEFESALPPDMEEILSYLENKQKSDLP